MLFLLSISPRNTRPPLLQRRRLVEAIAHLETLEAAALEEHAARRLEFRKRHVVIAQRQVCARFFARLNRAVGAICLARAIGTRDEREFELGLSVAGLLSAVGIGGGGRGDDSGRLVERGVQVQSPRRWIPYARLALEREDEFVRCDDGAEEVLRVSAPLSP